ncbi:MAG: acetoacetate decarboxylase family protein [Deltaproteobacteria bacterium]|nr:acetoacetate decarboxylase family protein [Deltaproteobacteria bacterium]
MGKQGKLTKDLMQSTMPVDAPAYHEKPFIYKGANIYAFQYETDEETARGLLPEQLSLTDTPTATLAFIEYDQSSLGPYREITLSIDSVYEGEQIPYLAYLFLDEDVPILAGREVYGFPKKKALIEFTRQEDVLGMYAERPRGIRICSGVMRDEMVFSPMEAGSAVSQIVLRAIPSPEENTRHSLLELVKVDYIIEKGEMSFGPGNCSFPGESELDPWHRLPVRKMLLCTHMSFNGTLAYGKILANLLE